MGVEWPLALLSLLVAAAAGRRRTSGSSGDAAGAAVRYSSVALIRAAAPPRSAWRRHVPFALLLGALACLGVAAARPHVSTDVPVSESALILALDVSGSMCATDVEPNRLTAAQAAVRDFVEAQDPGTSIGLVLFSGFAQVAVAPTTDREPLLRAIDSLTTGRGTTIGAAILKSVDAIAEINPDVAPADPDPRRSPDGPAARTRGTPPPRARVRSRRRSSCCSPTARNTRGIEPVEAAAIAADRGVRVYPIGFGTRNPTSMVCTAAQLGGRGFDSSVPAAVRGPGAAAAQLPRRRRGDAA